MNIFNLITVEQASAAAPVPAPAASFDNQDGYNYKNPTF